MFDISFSELLVIAVVALVVIGPEKLPKVARTAGVLFGRMQRMVSQVKEEINREARFEELQKLQREVATQVDEVKNSIMPPQTLIAVPKDDTKPKRKTALKAAVDKSDLKPVKSPVKTKTLVAKAKSQTKVETVNTKNTQLASAKVIKPATTKAPRQSTKASPSDTPT